MLVLLLFLVNPCSEGCASAIKRILGKVEGVSSVETDVAAKTVVVQSDGSVPPAELLEKLTKVSAEVL